METGQDLPLDSCKSCTTCRNGNHCLSQKQTNLPLSETVHLLDPAEPRTQHQLRPSASGHRINTSMCQFLASRQASSSLHQVSIDQQPVLYGGEIPLFCGSVISSFCTRPQTRTILPARSECLGDVDISPARPCWSEVAAHWLSCVTMEEMQQQRKLLTNPHCVAGDVTMIKHQVILSTGTRGFLWLWHEW